MDFDKRGMFAQMQITQDISLSGIPTDCAYNNRNVFVVIFISFLWKHIGLDYFTC